MNESELQRKIDEAIARCRWILLSNEDDFTGREVAERMIIILSDRIVEGRLIDMSLHTTGMGPVEVVDNEGKR